ncbi:MAG: hypothetical protein M0Z52_04670 [Actinomycetota bacterium]|nr:hypothetical protein [Actinomycetota bacterium]
MRARILYLALPVLLGVFIVPAPSWAHGFAGKRFFPTTFQVDDPFISDEFSILINAIKQPGDAPNDSTEINIDASKRLLPHFGFEFHEAYQHLGSSNDGSANGWETFGVGAKWQFLTDEKHEAIMSLGTDLDVGGTGARQLGSEPFTTISPGLFFGKGMGDLPDSVNFLQPVAITGLIQPSFPTKNGEEGDLNWGFTFQYSFIYLEDFVKDIGLGQPFKRMIFITEFPMTTCLDSGCAGHTTGTVNPGIVWAGKSAELGVAAEIPVNSGSGHSVGVLGLVHLFVDDLFPQSLGKPVFR